jgi:hypothetical protein
MAWLAAIKAVEQAINLRVDGEAYRRQRRSCHSRNIKRYQNAARQGEATKCARARRRWWDGGGAATDEEVY